MEPKTTNEDLAERIDGVEAKVDRLTALMEQATGAWFFIKLMASVGLGCAILYNAFKGLFQ